MPLVPPQKSLTAKLTTANPDSTRKAPQLLRSVCPHFAQRVILGRAYANGWDAPTLIKLAGAFPATGRPRTSPCKAAYHQAIMIGSERAFDASQPSNAYWLMSKAPAVDSDWPH